MDASDRAQFHERGQVSQISNGWRFERRSSLYLLAAPSTPAEVVEEVAARSREGERVTRSDVAEMVARVVHVETTYEDHKIIVPLGGPSRIEQRRERESAAIKQKLEDKVASVASLIRGDEPRPKIVQMKVRADLVPVHYQIDLMTVSAANRLTGAGPLTPFEQIIRLLPVLTDEEWDKLATIIRDRDQMPNSGS